MIVISEVGSHPFISMYLKNMFRSICYVLLPSFSLILNTILSESCTSIVRLSPLSRSSSFEKESIKQRIFYDAMKQIPGTLTGVSYRSSVLPNITVGEQGLVMIRALEKEEEEGNTSLILGPGRVSKLLDLERGDRRTIEVHDSDKMVFKINENEGKST